MSTLWVFETRLEEIHTEGLSDPTGAAAAAQRTDHL